MRELPEFPVICRLAWNLQLRRARLGLHIVDENGTSVVYNNKMKQIEGMDVEDVLGKNLLDVFTFAEHDSTLLQALQYGKTIKNVKQTYFNNKGQEITTVNHTFPILKNGNIKGL